jgi:hypothetical protein
MAGRAREEPGAWPVHGHLMANVDRLLPELDPEGQTWPGTSPTPDLRPSASAASLPWW